LTRGHEETETTAFTEEKKERQIGISSTKTEELFQTRKPRRRTTDPTDLLKLKSCSEEFLRKRLVKIEQLRIKVENESSHQVLLVGREKYSLSS